MEKVDLENQKERAVNLDLLRNLSMFLIIFLHSIDHSGVLEQASHSSALIHGWVLFTYSLVQVCVNLFVLISGYFLIKSSFRVEKLLYLWIETVFYSFVLKLIMMLTGNIHFSILSLISCFFPIITGRYWFITIYFGMYILFPFLNRAINGLSQEQHFRLNVVLFILFPCLVSIHPSLKGMNSGAGWGLTWFVVLYISASYLRLYYEPNGKWRMKLLLYIILSLFISCTCIFARNITIIYSIAYNMNRYDSVTSYVSSLLLFTCFLNIKCDKNTYDKWIVLLSSLTFGVYLIHTHADISPWIWKVLDLPDKMSIFAFPLIQTVCVLMVYIVSTVIDYCRNRFLRQKTTNIIKRIGFYGIVEHIDRLMNA